ncbi:MAG TPA: hypothetical protein HA257_03755 [Candidatus Methanoperedenaceae archaeon]|nr:hypothetical protein [Candidatus Methanoperedenaceae archaeon]
MAEKSLKAVCSVLIILSVLLVFYIVLTMSDRAQTSGQPTEVDEAVQHRGDYVDVILSIKNHHGADTGFTWEITLFNGDNTSETSSGAGVGSGGSLVHVASFFVGQHEQEKTRARIRVYEEGTMIDERVYTFSFLEA